MRGRNDLPLKHLVVEREQTCESDSLNEKPNQTAEMSECGDDRVRTRTNQRPDFGDRIAGQNAGRCQHHDVVIRKRIAVERERQQRQAKRGDDEAPA